MYSVTLTVVLQHRFKIQHYGRVNAGHLSQEMFQIVTNLITPRALFSPILLP